MRKQPGGGLTIEEALQIAYSDDLDVRNLYIELPDPTELTNGDSSDEDEGELIDNLSRDQLKAVAQLEILQIITHEDDDEFIENQSDAELMEMDADEYNEDIGNRDHKESEADEVEENIKNTQAQTQEKNV
ncbi:hypothetical protein NQ314_011719 [Rhamnusium bicolor]|uniref:Uncharacterized protein n=1 Tax=Rhamnusium bicolor TaxID=1586634 RepID=A0AAV8XGN6_9CUCU|nr:hypothetical protein NQ314_011719 [Rhamnusium bicolor]